ncbi:23_t:CDS:2, partial [Entrophospora sp. SA101]
MPRYLRADATPLSPEAICEIMNAKYTKNVLSVLVKKYKISNTRIYKIWRGQEYYAGLTFKVDQNQNIDWDKEIESTLSGSYKCQTNILRSKLSNSFSSSFATSTNSILSPLVGCNLLPDKS